MTYTPPEQPSGYTPAPAAGGYASASGSTKLSLWGLILGISSVILPFILNAIAGGVLSGMGLAKEPAGKTKAIWGLVLSILGFLWGLTFWLAVVPLLALAAFTASYVGS